MILIKLLILCLVVGINSGDGQTRTTMKCVCLKGSTSGYYCEEQSCETNYEYGRCFSGRSTVQTSDGKIVSLSNIQIGQEVLVFNGNKLIFERIYDVIHHEKKKYYPFIQLIVLNDQLNSTHAIEISSKHLIFKYGKTEAVFASEIQIGDYLQLVIQSNIFPGKVIQVNEILSQGFSAPLTYSGTIIVNDLVCSNYAEARNHHLAHLVMQPYRWWRTIFRTKQIIETDLDWYSSILYYLADKFNLLNSL